MGGINASLITASMVEALPFRDMPKGILISENMGIDIPCPNVSIVKTAPERQGAVTLTIKPSSKNVASSGLINIEISSNIHNSSYSYNSTNRMKLSSAALAAN